MLGERGAALRILRASTRPRRSDHRHAVEKLRVMRRFRRGKRGLIDWMKFTLPGFVYSVGCRRSSRPPPPRRWTWCRRNPGASPSSPQRRIPARHGAGRRPRYTPAIGRAVIPILFNLVWETMAVCSICSTTASTCRRSLQVGVPKGQAAPALFISANHTEDEIRQVVQLIVDRPTVEPPRQAVRVPQLRPRSLRPFWNASNRVARRVWPGRAAAGDIGAMTASPKLQGSPETSSVEVAPVAGIRDFMEFCRVPRLLYAGAKGFSPRSTPSAGRSTPTS